ncbi:E3 CR1-beta1 [Titi monkey adenovirus ECC-2011]|uniref:E3 CR1-beta1 n=1 Tax=titi monkey adenovirus 1 TaxID=3123084 RepID=G0ZAJ4_9ADEN|nr:E3 CR1-beta1 [Titi monkey adenovirus ECC-2011]AEK98465.1 E3 CR1-beta1 [Titi monkey adenovirus ECC-2011]
MANPRLLTVLACLAILLTFLPLCQTTCHERDFEVEIGGDLDIDVFQVFEHWHITFKRLYNRTVGQRLVCDSSSGPTDYGFSFNDHFLQLRHATKDHIGIFTLEVEYNDPTYWFPAVARCPINITLVDFTEPKCILGCTVEDHGFIKDVMLMCNTSHDIIMTVVSDTVSTDMHHRFLATAYTSNLVILVVAFNNQSTAITHFVMTPPWINDTSCPNLITINITTRHGFNDNSEWEEVGQLGFSHSAQSDAVCDHDHTSYILIIVIAFLFMLAELLFILYLYHKYFNWGRGYRGPPIILENKSDAPAPKYSYRYA